jgi:hypothetical protein
VRLVGKPILVFERSRMDHQTGERVLNSWWLNDEPALGVAQRPTGRRARRVTTSVILELAGARRRTCGGGQGRPLSAVDAAASTTRRLLPAGAAARELSTTYRNGILQVRLGKEAT